MSIDIASVLSRARNRVEQLLRDESQVSNATAFVNRNMKRQHERQLEQAMRLAERDGDLVSTARIRADMESLRKGQRDFGIGNITRNVAYMLTQLAIQESIGIEQAMWDEAHPEEVAKRHAALDTTPEAVAEPAPQTGTISNSPTTADPPVGTEAV